MPPTTAPAAPPRVAAIDALRGLAMAMMLAEALRLPAVAARFPDSPAWQAAGRFQTHADWGGLTPHDLIQPVFSFLVGTSLAFSLAARAGRGESKAATIGHAAWRAVVLVALGIFLRSTNSARTNFTFEDTLTQIGLGYLPLVLVALAGARVLLLTLAVVLVGYWALFAGWPVPGPAFDWPAAGVPADWPHHPAGFAAHWDKNSNPAAAFDGWFLNLFPRPDPFRFNRGGYVTLSFVPTLGTMILGLLAGTHLRAGGSGRDKVTALAAAGLAGLAVGLLLDAAGVCPSVKRVWTPSWVLVSGGISAALLAAFYLVCDVLKLTRWAVPLVAVGANSIVAYCLDHLAGGFVRDSLRRHLGPGVFGWAGPDAEPVVGGAATLVVFGLILGWLWRRKVFVRI